MEFIIKRSDKEIENMNLDGLIKFRKKYKPMLFAIRGSICCECCGEFLYDVYPDIYDKETLLASIESKIKPIQDLVNKLTRLIREKQKQSVIPLKKDKKIRNKIRRRP